MSDTPNAIERALAGDPSWWLSTIPSPPFDVQRIREDWNTLVEAAKRLQGVERELAALKAEREWRDIASAPRDGTRVLTACGLDVSVSWWSDDEGGVWFDDDFDAMGKVCQPTHWLPLPPPPQLEVLPPNGATP